MNTNEITTAEDIEAITYARLDYCDSEDCCYEDSF